MEKLEKMLDDQVTDEFKTVLFYDKIIGRMTEKREEIKDVDKHIEALRRIQKEQSIHELELLDMILDMGFKEPKIIGELGEFIKVKEY